MTREEAIAVLEESKRQNEIMRDNPSTFWASHQMAEGVKNAKRRIEAFEVALSALRPVSGEQVEKAWRGCSWCNNEGKKPENWECSLLDDRGFSVVVGDEVVWTNAEFCPVCGKPLTDEAVEMVMERLEELHDTSN